MREGLIISLVGLSLTFTALALFIGVIAALKRFFPAAVEPEPEPADQADVVAAIAGALAYWQSSGPEAGALGKALEEGRGPWWRP